MFKFPKALPWLAILFLAIMLQVVNLLVAPDIHSSFGVQTMVEGKSPSPYSYRMLMPALVRATDAVLPGGVKAKLEKISTESPTIHEQITANRLHSLIAGHLQAGPEGARSVIEWSLLSVLCYTLFGGSILLFSRRLGLPEGTAVALSLAAMAVIMPIILRPPLQMYDPLTLALGGLLAYLALQKKTIAFFVVLAIAAFAKESLLALALWPIVEAIQAKDYKKAGFFLIGVSIIFVVARLVVRSLTGMDYVTELQYADNLAILTGRNTAAFVMTLLFLTPIALLIRSGWAGLDKKTRTCAWILLGLFTIPLLVYGRLVEARVFYDLIPLFCMLSILGQGQEREREQEQGPGQRGEQVREA